MKLQINDRGSWRHVADFKAEDERAVRQQAAKLVVVVNERASLRILGEKSEVRATCRPPNFDWQERS